MPISVVPTVLFETEEKRDTFLSLLRDISSVTLRTEPNCVSYAWFLQSSHENIPGPYRIRGLEIYMNDDDLSVTHRSSPPYKEMRRSARDDKLLTPPFSDLTFRVPAGVGFLSKSSVVEPVTGEDTFVVISEYTKTKSNDSQVLLQCLKIAAESLQHEQGAMSYFVLQWQEPKKEAEYLVFERYSSRSVYDGIKEGAAFKRLYSMVSDWQVDTTRWQGGGVGFIRDNSL